MTTRIDLKESLAAAKPISGNRWRAKLIGADRWGSTAYYPSEVLERDGSRIFTAGIQMFQNHMTESEKWEQPEGKVENLVGKLASDAEFDANGADGPGLYADVEFYPSYVERIKEIGNDIGLSVRASGLTEEAEMDGRFGPVLLAFLAADSVDVVTRAGAGGKLTSILESDRELAGRPVETKEGTSMDVTKEDFEGFQTSILEAINSLSATLKESLAEKPEESEEDAKLEEPIVQKNDEAGTAVEIDHAAVVEALRNNDLPAISAREIVASIREGKTLDEAVAHAVEIREAYTASVAETGNVTIIKESTDAAHGLSRAVKVLG